MQQPLKSDYPELYSFAKNKWISVHSVYHQQSINGLFGLPLSTEAFSQLQAVESIREHFPLMDQHDIWNSNWGAFSSSRAYKFLIGDSEIHQAFN